MIKLQSRMHTHPAIVLCARSHVLNLDYESHCTCSTQLKRCLYMLACWVC